jgi:hypothetical protein
MQSFSWPALPLSASESGFLNGLGAEWQGLGEGPFDQNGTDKLEKSNNHRNFAFIGSRISSLFFEFCQHARK